MKAFSKMRLLCKAPARLLGSLLWDNRGNAAVLIAAAFLPLLAMIGSGLDLSRTYLVHAKLQSACDSAALAARRSMATSTLDQDSIDEGAKYFAFNFPNGTMGTTPVTPNIHISDTDASTVVVQASTTVPMTVMKVFGFDTLPASVTCSADQDYVNNDIMLVLDVTASMNYTAGDSSCQYQATEQSNARIARLRTAGVALYRALEGATGVRIRYGFMPYSMTVNVGRDLDSGWLEQPGKYWQQVPECTQFNSNGSCRRTSLRWRFNPATAQHNSSWWANTWEGCVEERSTMSQSGNSIAISPDVSQADIDQTGNSQGLRWQAYDDDIDQGYTDLFGPNNNLAHFCPAPAKRLATYATEADFQSALNASVAKVGGYTNHDLGIMWGMRYLSSTGMFSADNPTVFPAGSDVPVQKHIVFLTDGVMTASGSNYSSFGIPDKEDRMTGSGTLVQRHINRFVNACDRARQMGATIWVIALDVQSPGTISPCASGSDHFFISNGSDLEQVFTRIGKGIGRLRMTQ
jgi:Flp pilus assembly protein TadG